MEHEQDTLETALQGSQALLFIIQFTTNLKPKVLWST